MKNKIAIITGSRSDYGLLKPIISSLSCNELFDFKLFVTGSHLSPEFGLTYKEIEKDGFKITNKIEMLISTDSDLGIAKSIGVGVISFVDVFSYHSIEKIIVLGDRYEIFSAVQAAAFMKLKIVHIHGGEITEGVIDDNIRHAITKFSHLHFVANDQYKKRVIQLGEDPKTVFNVGAPGLDNIKNTKLLSKKNLENFFNIKFKDKIFISTFHPLIKISKNESGIDHLLNALSEFSDVTIIFTFSNADAGSKKIISKINDFVKKKENSFIFNSLGYKNYYSFLKLSDLVIGNSSSGIIEAPFLKTPTINIGDRQKGRLKASSIIDVRENKIDILNAIDKVMTKKFRNNLNKVKSYYGNGNATVKIINKLVNFDPPIIKKFNDIN